MHLETNSRLRSSKNKLRSPMSSKLSRRFSPHRIHKRKLKLSAMTPMLWRKHRLNRLRKLVLLLMPMLKLRQMHRLRLTPKRKLTHRLLQRPKLKLKQGPRLKSDVQLRRL